MKQFTIYHSTTGKVLRTGVIANDADLPAQVRQNEGLHEGERLDLVNKKMDMSKHPPVPIDITPANVVIDI